MDNCWRCRLKSRWCNVDEDVHTYNNPMSPGYRAFFVTPAARLNLFAHTAVSPWVSVGGGFSHFNGSATQFQPKTGTTNGVFQIGGGLDVVLHRKFSLRGELRDFWSGVPQLKVSTNQSRQHNLFVGGGCRLALMSGRTRRPGHPTGGILTKIC